MLATLPLFVSLDGVWNFGSVGEGRTGERDRVRERDERERDGERSKI